jgi:hypothetical protein
MILIRNTDAGHWPAFFWVRPAGRTHREVDVPYSPCEEKRG